MTEQQQQRVEELLKKVALLKVAENLAFIYNTVPVYYAEEQTDFVVMREVGAESLGTDNVALVRNAMEKYNCKTIGDIHAIMLSVSWEAVNILKDDFLNVGAKIDLNPIDKFKKRDIVNSIAFPICAHFEVHAEHILGVVDEIIINLIGTIDK